MAVEIFLKLDGVDGESTKTGHEQEIEIIGVSHGASNASTVFTGTGSGTGKVELHPITVTKYVDNSSTKLFQMCCNGKHFDTGKITYRKASGDDNNPLEFLTIDLQEVFVTSVTHSATNGGDLPTETVTFSCKQIVSTYLPQNADGSAGTKQVGGWNVAKNAAAAGS